jgi:signal transduction histidine kinase
MITERFSNIGSVPQLKHEQLLDTTMEVVRYLERRISTKVKIEISAFPNSNIVAPLNRSLFAWVIENLIKNAVDAMEGKGDIKIRILKVNEGNIAIDITDSGKGLSKSKVDEIFKPGYSTKKRGWGLGLTLAKRIVENYHGGKIFVKETEINKGTTFRILLKSS